MTAIQCSNELRKAILRRILPPNSEPISRVVSEKGIPSRLSVFRERVAHFFTDIHNTATKAVIGIT